MGTRGLLVFRFKGVYYYFYYDCDGGYDVLGKSIVKDIVSACTNGSIKNWGAMLYKLKHDEKTECVWSPIKLLKGGKYWEATNKMKMNKQFDIAYSFIIDLDKHTLTMYNGSKKSTVADPHKGYSGFGFEFCTTRPFNAKHLTVAFHRLYGWSVKSAKSIGVF